MLTTKLREHDAQLNDRTSASDAPSSRTSGLPHHGHGGGFESSSCSTDAALVRAAGEKKRVEANAAKYRQSRSSYDSDAHQYVQLVYIRT
jgi:hypothetical protein